MNVTRSLPKGFTRGPNQGQGIIGEVTESLHRFLLDGWPTNGGPPPRIEEDLSFIPKDREEILYVYMYRVAQNTALNNAKRFRESRVNPSPSEREDGDETFYERPPLYLDLHYMVAVHSKFRSDAERLIGWVLLRLHEATHLVYRPRRFILPDGREVDSTGQPWNLEAKGEDVVMEKVSVALIDDLTVGDAINFFTIHEAPYRPYLTYRARCAMEGALISAPSATTVRVPNLLPPREDRPSHERPGGRLGRMETRPKAKKAPFGPDGHDLRPIEDNNESED
jgi:hypothetical protein